MNMKKVLRYWNIKFPQRTGESRFVQAILGCDTTFRVLNIEKSVVVKEIKLSDHFQQQAAVFLFTYMPRLLLEKMHYNQIVCLYNGKPGYRLDTASRSYFS